MTDSDHSSTEEQQNFISQFIQSIEQSLNSLLGKYQIIASETSSQEAFTELCNLDNQITELDSKIKDIHKYEINTECLDRDREKLKTLQEELREVVQELRTLKDNVDNLKSLAEDLLLDPQDGDTLDIVDVDLKRKSENDERWTITVKAGNKNKGNFRNVKIVENENNILVPNILLIEPGMTVRVHCERPLNVGSYIFAKIDDSVILSQFYVFHLKIVEVINNNPSSIIIKNLSKEYISNSSIYGEGVQEQVIFEIQPFETIIEKLTLQANTEKLVLYNLENSISLSANFIINHRSTDDFYYDLTPDQMNLFKMHMGQNPGVDKNQLKQAILNGSIY